MQRRIVYAAVLVVFALAALSIQSEPATAGPFEEGVQAFQRQDYATARKLWLPLAEHGHAAAQYNMGVLYDEGRGVTQDYREAVKWYELAAAQGNQNAQYNLGAMHGNGQGVTQDCRQMV